MLPGVRMGRITPAATFAAQITEITADQETSVAKVDNLMTVHDCGVVINPVSVDGQLNGCMHRTLGHTLYEEFKIDEKENMLSKTFLDYKLPIARGIPDCEPFFID